MDSSLALRRHLAEAQMKRELKARLFEGVLVSHKEVAYGIRCHSTVLLMLDGQVLEVVIHTKYKRKVAPAITKHLLSNPLFYSTLSIPFKLHCNTKLPTARPNESTLQMISHQQTRKRRRTLDSRE